VAPSNERVAVACHLGLGLHWADQVLGRARARALFPEPLAVVYPHRPTWLMPETFVHPMTSHLTLRGLQEKHRGSTTALAYEAWHELGHILHFQAMARRATSTGSERALRLRWTARLLGEEIILQRGQGHWLSKPTTRLVALAEGWASYVAQAIYAFDQAGAGLAPASGGRPSTTPVPLQAGPRSTGARQVADLAHAGHGAHVEGGVASFLWRLEEMTGPGGIAVAFDLLGEGFDDIEALIERWVLDGRPWSSTARDLGRELGLLTRDTGSHA
jgi:hypothetical protein